MLPILLPTHGVARVSEMLGRDKFKYSSVKKRAHPYLDQS
jgi:hypothetical protein